jgi:hypothetical protein
MIKCDGTELTKDTSGGFVVEISWRFSESFAMLYETIGYYVCHQNEAAGQMLGTICSNEVNVKCQQKV